MAEVRERDYSIPLLQSQMEVLARDTTGYKVQKLLGDGNHNTVSSIAEELGVSLATVRRHIRNMAREGTVQLCQMPEAMRQLNGNMAAPEIVLDTQIDVLNQLKDANESMWELVEKLEKQSSQRGSMTVAEMNAYIRAMGEVRQQLQLQANLVEMMLKLDTIKEFQQEVLMTIEEVDPEVAKKIRTKLIERRAMRSATSI